MGMHTKYKYFLQSWEFVTIQVHKKYNYQLQFDISHKDLYILSMHLFHQNSIHQSMQNIVRKMNKLSILLDIMNIKVIYPLYNILECK